MREYDKATELYNLRAAPDDAIPPAACCACGDDIYEGSDYYPTESGGTMCIDCLNERRHPMEIYTEVTGEEIPGIAKLYLTGLKKLERMTPEERKAVAFVDGTAEDLAREYGRIKVAEFERRY